MEKMAKKKKRFKPCTKLPAKPAAPCEPGPGTIYPSRYMVEKYGYTEAANRAELRAMQRYNKKHNINFTSYERKGP